MAVSSQSYYAKFVYVEVEGMPPTGLYDVADAIQEKGHTREEYGEYGFFKKKYISREEYEDGATVIKGKVRNMHGKTKLRSRIIGKYNFIIAAHASPINCQKAEIKIENILDEMLTGASKIENLASYISRLPKNSMDR